MKILTILELANSSQLQFCTYLNSTQNRHLDSFQKTLIFAGIPNCQSYFVLIIFETLPEQKMKCNFQQIHEFTWSLN